MLPGYSSASLARLATRLAASVAIIEAQAVTGCPLSATRVPTAGGIAEVL